MYVYNLGIHCLNDKTGHMYVYDETQGGRGSEDISSCLIKHLKEHTAKYAHIIIVLRRAEA